jgi:hypothetical protein
MDGKCIYCSDRSAGAPTLTVSWTLLPSFYWFFMCSFSGCQYLVLDVIPLFNGDEISADPKLSSGVGQHDVP